MGSLKAPLGMSQCWNGHGFEDVWLALLFFVFLFFLFSFKSENNNRYMHKRVNVIGLAATRSRCNRIVSSWRMMNLCEQKKSIWRLKKSILFVLPDILMFNMRVLYYHDYDYSCAILVYCCLNVTLFFYDMMRWNRWAWEWWPSFKKKKIESETRSYLYTESECCRWLANSCQVKSSIISHGALLLSSRCTILNAVLLYYLDETLSNYKMYIDILPTHCSYM